MQSNKGSIISKLVTYVIISLFIAACSPKSGCPINDDAVIKVNRKGELPTKRGKSNLFSQKGAVKVKKAQKRRKKQRKKLYSKRRN